jgi:hypothetical protein
MGFGRQECVGYNDTTTIQSVTTVYSLPGNHSVVQYGVIVTPHITVTSLIDSGISMAATTDGGSEFDPAAGLQSAGEGLDAALGSTESFDYPSYSFFYATGYKSQ